MAQSERESALIRWYRDIFREDLEEWRAASAEARAKLKLLKGAGGTTMDDDGGPPTVGGMWDGFDSIPIGIKAFMETEKRLKDRHKMEGSIPG